MQHPGIVQIRALVRSLNYVVITHASDELDDDNLSILDLENVVLTGSITASRRRHRAKR